MPYPAQPPPLKLFCVHHSHVREVQQNLLGYLYVAAICSAKNDLVHFAVVIFDKNEVIDPSLACSTYSFSIDLGIEI